LMPMPPRSTFVVSDKAIDSSLSKLRVKRRPSVAHPKELRENVKVFVRVRPQKKAQHAETIEVLDEQGVKITTSHVGKAVSKSFGVDRVFDQSASQHDIYEIGVAPLVARFMAGYNGCVFAYGQTGSGKTYTMLGGDSNMSTTFGLIPRVLKAIFQYAEDDHENSTFVSVSCLEIYNEQLRDLTRGDTDGPPLAIREVPGQQLTYVQNLSKIECISAKEANALLASAIRERVVGATEANVTSSRSHMVFQVHCDLIAKGDTRGYTKQKSVLNLVDLAGSERQGDTKARGQRLKEGAQINLSLTMLGKVINALAKEGASHVPFRDSKLTRLLQPALGGSSCTVLLACISSETKHANDSLATMRFAQRAKEIKLHAKANKGDDAEYVAELLRENAELKEALAVANRQLARLKRPKASKICTIS